MAVGDFVWTDEAVAQLVELWQSKLSGSQIGRIMGTTANSVIGKLHRLGLQKRGDISNRPGTPRPRPKKERSMPKEPTPLPVSEDISDGIPMEKLVAHSCRFPLNSGETEYLFCGQEKFGQSAYCWTHLQRCVNIAKAKVA